MENQTIQCTHTMSPFKFTINKELINAFQANPCLWDTNSTDYHNKVARKSALEELCRVLGLNVNENNIKLVKAKIKWMRDGFSKEVRKEKAALKNGLDSTHQNTSKWKWYKDLKFLGTDVTVDSMTDSDITSSLASPPDSRRENMELVGSNTVESPSFDQSRQSCVSYFEPPLKQKRLNHGIREPLQDIISQSRHYYFAMFVADELESMSPDRAKAVRRAIQQVLLNYDH